MNRKIVNVINGDGGNYIFPFFWQRGEDEETLRTYMQKIAEANMKAVCVESRPHPDFCGPGWWRDMDIILDEARRRKMKVWILDDSHFPTGYANGAMAGQPDSLCRQSLCKRSYDCCAKKTLRIEAEELSHPAPFEPTKLDFYIGEKNPRQFDDDRRLGIVAVRKRREEGEGAVWLDLEPYIRDGVLEWRPEEGEWRVYVLYLSRNQGYHRSYINMMSLPSCRVQIDAVYEPHYSHYKEDFGTTIAGFFSDEPELGNGHIFEGKNLFGRTPDLPWSDELEAWLRKERGDSFLPGLAMLWEEDADALQKAQARYAYMNAVTELVKQDFSEQIGTWCRERGVQYIGHMIEDNNQHTRTGSSLGHYFRGLAGQDMAGIDDIGGQVLPQGEDENLDEGPFRTRIGEFYHYMLGTMAASAAAIEPGKHGDSMCEIFGAYGWSEGVRPEKYLVDHFLVRGINHFVPHAFSAKEFPDPDCPPHFYAHGNNPQYRHFASLMGYTNRACELINGGRHIAKAAVLYHAEAEWTGTCMFSHKVGHVLADAQINYDYIPQDVFADRETYRLSIENGILKVNTQEYRIVLIPAAQFVTAALAKAVCEMTERGIKVCFVETYPEGICNLEGTGLKETNLLAEVQEAELIELEEVSDIADLAGAKEVVLSPVNDRIRYYHYEYEDGNGVYFFINEGTEKYNGNVRLEDSRWGYFYDAWENRLHGANYNGEELKLELEPRKSVFLILDREDQRNEPEENRLFTSLVTEKLKHGRWEASELRSGWKRSICRSIDYPAFADRKTIELPDCLEEEEKLFSGFVRYENIFYAQEGQEIILEITDAYEGVEVFVNGRTLGIQIVPVYRYDLSDVLQTGENTLVIEVATTLEREMSQIPDQFGVVTVPTVPSGINGMVYLYQKKKQVYNPFLPLEEYIPDGEPHVFGDRIYLFGSHDLENGETYCMQPYQIYSASVKDLRHWSSPGISYRAERDPKSCEGRHYMYAPDAVRGNDGRYYLYYCFGGYEGPINVAVSDTPDGKYEYLGTVQNPDGTAYHRFIPFDPAVINDEGTIRLYYGALYPFEDARTPENSEMFDQIQSKMFGKTMEELKEEPGGVMGPVTVELAEDMMTVISEPRRITPVKAKGTCWEEHPFFEGASIRKIKGMYYFIYSSFKNHELCYATSQYPDREFVFGGTIISAGDVGYQGRSEEDRINATGTTHGSIECINGQWYVFYHRLTHGSDYSRQACAEPIEIMENGSIPQVEVTSCGLNGEPLAGSGRYPAVICCNLTNGHMPHSSNQKNREMVPCVYSDGKDRFVHNIENGTWIGYKYFCLNGMQEIKITYRGDARGRLSVTDRLNASELAGVEINPSADWKTCKGLIPFPKGKSAIYFKFTGEGLMDLLSFELCERKEEDDEILL